MTTMDLSLFEKIDARPSNGASMRNSNIIKMFKKGYRTTIPSSIIAKLGWKKGDKVDLYKLGQTYALKRAIAGDMRLNAACGGTSGTLLICNQKLWLNTVPHENDIDEFYTWIENDVLFFKRTAENVEF